MISDGNKHSALVGQIGNILAVLSTVIFMVILGMLRGVMSEFADAFEEAVEEVFDLKASASWSVYLAIVTGAVNFVFITMRKEIIRGL
jgi:hypothetical protein